MTTCLSCSVGLDTIAFARTASYPSLYKPYVIMAADLDRDGDLDLVVLDEESSTVSVLVNNGHATFAPLRSPTPYGFVTGEYPTDGAIADLDGDGVLDVITSDYHGDSVSVLRGAIAGGTYTLEPAASYPTAAGGETSSLAVADLDGDGALDVIATDPTTSEASVLLGNGDGTLGAARQLPIVDPGTIEPPAPFSVAVGDLDGDGVPDAAIADNANDHLVIELGNGDGTFRRGATPAIDGTAPFGVIAHDLDGDGRLDLIIADRGSDDVNVLRGRGDGTFDAPIVVSTGAGTGPYDVTTADVDLDGVPDLITADYLTGSATVLRGIGHAKFAKPIDAGPTGAYCYSVVAGDLDGDGKPDLAAANAVDNDVTISINTSH
jgi:hypothetical protein